LNATLTVSGIITANAGTNLNTSALALESGGNLATVAGAVRAEDAASADGHTGIGLLAVRKGTPANTSGADGDYEFLQISGGRLWASVAIDTALPSGSNVIGALSANQSINNAQVGGTVIDTNSGNKSAGTQRVTIASDQTPLVAGTGTRSSVNGSATSVTVLASNSNRKGAIFYNDSTATLYLDLSGATASSSNYSVQIPSQGYFELPPQPIYTGAITGIWSSATGAVKVTEWT
jgi:hypothetical protein